MEMTRGKLASLAVAVVYALAGLIVGGPGGGLAAVLLCLAPLTLIWFDEELGEFTGSSGGFGPRVDQESPPWAIAALGWVALVSLPALIIVFT